MQPTKAKVGRYISLALLALVVLFALQNIQETTVTVFAWSYSMPLIIVIMVSFAIGIIVGWIYPFRPFGGRTGGNGGG